MKSLLHLFHRGVQIAFNLFRFLEFVSVPHLNHASASGGLNCPSPCAVRHFFINQLINHSTYSTFFNNELFKFTLCNWRSHERSLPRETFLIFCLTGAHFTGGWKSPENTALVGKNQNVSVVRPQAHSPCTLCLGLPNEILVAFI